MLGEWSSKRWNGDSNEEKNTEHYTLQYNKCCERANCMYLYVHVHRKCKKKTNSPKGEKSASHNSLLDQLHQAVTGKKLFC